MSILRPGDKVLVAHRRLYEADSGRFFLARVDAYEAGIARITGHTWVRDRYRNDLQQKADEATKVISIASGSLIVYALPEHVELASAEFDRDASSLVLRAGDFTLDLSESVAPAGPNGAADARPDLSSI